MAVIFPDESCTAMDRRCFLRASTTTAAACWASPLLADPVATKSVAIVSVTGNISPEQLGTALPHEHVLVDFIGADKVSRQRYDRDEVFSVVLPQLKRLRAAGCQALVECTPAYLGRDPLLLKRLGDASGVTILTNTGYYGARQGKFLPAHAFNESADQLAAPLAQRLASWHRRNGHPSRLHQRLESTVAP